MKENFVINVDTPIVVSQGEPECVMRSIRDLSNDWYMVFGVAPFVWNEVPEGYTGSVIYVGAAAEQFAPKPTERESYEILAQDNRLLLLGSDELGVIYAIYKFSEAVLGVDPWYFWNDIMPERKKEITLPGDFRLAHGAPTYKYRGFFINNEDMLSGAFRDPLYENFMSTYHFDKICELILRLYGNVIAPGTRPYPDESVRDIASRRGLYVNDHHVTPLGLNVYMWPEDKEFSYITNAEEMESMWKKCIDAQKHRKMLWTVSFRGKGDGPFWDVDPAAPKTEAERADIINRAVAKQVEMIREVQPDADIIFNMYFEQAELCKKGLLHIPEGVIRVWPNDGAGVMSDGGAAAEGDGAYYHITACRNRWTEAVSPETIFSELGRIKKAGATGCLIMNVGNIRIYPVSLGTAMGFAYDSDKYLQKEPGVQMEETILEYTKKHYGDCAGEAAELYTKFFRCSNFRRPVEGMAPVGWGAECLGMYPVMWKSSYNQVLTEFRQSLYMHEIARKYIRVLKGEEEFAEIWEKTVDDFNSILHERNAYLPELSVKAEALYPRIPGRTKQLFLENPLTQIKVVNQLNNAMEFEGLSLKAFMKADREQAVLYMEQAIACMKEIFESVHEAEGTKWSTWYQYESLACYPHTYDLLKCVLSLLQGKGETQVRPFAGFGGHGKQIFFYQYLKENKNYPLLK